MRRKSQGASLIVVMIVFMFLTIVSTAMLSMILGNYKARIAESKRVENLYASDSGLDVAYNVIGKNFDAAVKYGYYEVEAMKDGQDDNKGPNNEKYADISNDIQLLKDEINDIDTNIQMVKDTPQNYPDVNLSDLENKKAQKQALINGDKELQQVLINEEFKRAFNNFIQVIDDKSTTVDENVPENQLKNLIEQHSYVDMSGINDSNINQSKSQMVINFGINNKEGNTSSISPDFNVEIQPENIAYDSDPDHEVGITASDGGHHYSVEIDPLLKQGYYNIAVTSSFYNEKLTGNSDELSKTNERQVKANFKLSVPEFSDISNQEAGGALQYYLATQDRAITVNGNMNLNEADGFSVTNGEVYVGGTTPSEVEVSNRSYEKYSGGIMVCNSKSVEFSKDVITRNTLNLRSGANVKIEGNLYGGNIYVGGSTYNSSDINNSDLNQLADSAELSIEGTNDNTGKVIIDNDLGVKATNSNITIKDFFGVNDKNITSTGNPVDAYGHQVDRTKSSSSIIVNSTDDSSNIVITDSAYIMGTAHVNTNETDTDSRNEYQTGESAAVKENYIAYTVLDPSDPTETLKYYNPLQLLDSTDVFKKAMHFFNYWRAEMNKGNKPNMGGIQLPIVENSDGSIDTTNSKVYTVGALVFEKKDGSGNVVAKNVVKPNYNMDLETPGGAIYNAQAEYASKVYRFNQSATKPYDYDKTQVTDFKNLVDTANISSSGYTLDSQSNNGQYAIFNGEKNKTIRIKKSDDSSDKIIKDDGNGNIEIQVGEKKGKYILNSVIVSAGNILIDDDDIVINGCVIVGGDFNVNLKKNININYDQGVIQSVQAKNQELFKDVFGKMPVDNTEDTQADGSATSPTGAATNDSASFSYDLKYFLEKKLWQIIK